jgi:hypothetical protein
MALSREQATSFRTAVQKFRTDNSKESWWQEIVTAFCKLWPVIRNVLGGLAWLPVVGTYLKAAEEIGDIIAEILGCPVKLKNGVAEVA